MYIYIYCTANYGYVSYSKRKNTFGFGKKIKHKSLMEVLEDSQASCQSSACLDILSSASLGWYKFDILLADPSSWLENQSRSQWQAWSQVLRSFSYCTLVMAAHSSSNHEQLVQLALSTAPRHWPSPSYITTMTAGCNGKILHHRAATPQGFPSRYGTIETSDHQRLVSSLSCLSSLSSSQWQFRTICQGPKRPETLWLQ